jgi:hypothetical protein
MHYLPLQWKSRSGLLLYVRKYKNTDPMRENSPNERKICPMSEKFAQWAKESPNLVTLSVIEKYSLSSIWIFSFIALQTYWMLKVFFFFSIWFAVRALQPDIVKGCQIFLVATHQNRKKIYLIALKHINWPPNLTNGHKIYQMVVK